MTDLLQDGVRYLTDSGLETTLVFLEGHDLPAFAAFPLLDTQDGRDRLTAYYRQHADVARAAGMGFVFETPTWRANPDWGGSIGYDAKALRRVNAGAVSLCRAIAAQYPDIPTLVSGQIGPRGDGYAPAAQMSAEEAEAYHSLQVEAFGAPDMVTALTMTSAQEAIGIVRAARTAAVQVVISFTVETDGRLITGPSLADAIAQTDDATKGYAAYFMVNCAHPDHFAHTLDGKAAARIRGLRANASTKSHAELDAAEVLDIGDPDALGAQYRALSTHLDGLAVVGGCCGTDIRHIRKIAAATVHRDG